MRINELLICMWDCSGARKYAIKFYLLIYGCRQICIDYANGVGAALLVACGPGLNQALSYNRTCPLTRRHDCFKPLDNQLIVNSIYVYILKYIYSARAEFHLPQWPN